MAAAGAVDGVVAAVRYDLSDVKLAEALDDPASVRWFCGFSGAPMSAVMFADVLVMLAGNHGYRAGVLGQRVLVVDPTAEGLPVNFGELGMAARAPRHDRIDRRAFYDRFRLKRRRRGPC